MPKRKAQTSLTSRRKRAKLIDELEADLPDLAEVEAIISEFTGTTETAPKRKSRKRAPRKPTLKSTLLKKLRARKKTLTTELREVNRDIKSLTCRRKKNE